MLIATCVCVWVCVCVCMYVQVIAAEGEKCASRSLKEAADVINESANALQLRYLQTLTQVSAEKNSTIIFPLPVELLSSLIMSSETDNETQHKSIDSNQLTLTPVDDIQLEHAHCDNAATAAAAAGCRFCSSSGSWRWWWVDWTHWWQHGIAATSAVLLIHCQLVISPMMTSRTVWSAYVTVSRAWVSVANQFCVTVSRGLRSVANQSYVTVSRAWGLLLTSSVSLCPGPEVCC